MGKGWISLSRGIQDCYLWQEKPYSRGQAWVDLILLANHKDAKVILGNELIDVKRGSFITSELKLMAKWGWGKEKLRAFLKILEADNMIVKKSDHKKTTITIVNYSVYQDKQTTDRPIADHEQTTSRPSADTNNNDNNDNNDNKKNIGRFTPPTLDDIKAYCIERQNNVDCERFYDFYSSKGWMVGKNKMKDWKAAVRTWEKSDKDKPTTKKTNKFNDFPQREYTDQDTRELEQKFMSVEYMGKKR